MSNLIIVLLGLLLSIPFVILMMKISEIPYKKAKKRIEELKKMEKENGTWGEYEIK